MGFGCSSLSLFCIQEKEEEKTTEKLDIFNKWFSAHTQFGRRCCTHIRLHA